MTQYEKILLKIRTNNNQWSLFAQRKIERTLQKAYNDLTKMITGLGEDKPLQLFNYTSRRSAIAKLAQRMSVSISLDIKDAMYVSAKYSIKNHTDMYDKIAKKYGREIDWGSFQSVAPDMAIMNCINRIWSDGNNFSQRMWNLTKHGTEGINEILSSGIARGQSAVNMSKDLQRFLVDPELTPTTTWTTGVKPSVTGRGTINYNALRIARTEINNSYREAQVISNEASPVTDGVKWNLSRSHPKPDICDQYAEANLYGMGKGIYPAEQVPIDHPNGLCFLTDVLRPPSEWNKPKSEGRFREDIPDIKGVGNINFIDKIKSVNKLREKLPDMKGVG